MEARIYVIQEHDGTWWFCANYGDARGVSFAVEYHQLDWYHQEGIPVIPNR